MVSSSLGEQDALRGYGYQYDLIAVLVYDHYVDTTAFELRLADPEAGAVDDCVLILPPHEAQGPRAVHGYQFKSDPGSVTLNGLLARETSRSGGPPKDSLLKQLCDGWAQLRARYPGDRVTVHLVSRGKLSTYDKVLTAAARKVALATAPALSGAQHTAQFVAQVLEPLAAGEDLEKVDSRWLVVLQWLRDELGIQDGDLAAFLAALRLDTGVPAPLGGWDEDTGDPERQRRRDLTALASALSREVQNSERATPVVVTPGRVAQIAGFGTRGLNRHAHAFPVDIDLYVPLADAADQLTSALDEVTHGYLGLIGPPGSGKSTLLAQATSGLAEPVVTYLAYLPGDPANASGRVSAADFLHDVVLSLQSTGPAERSSLPEPDINELRIRFRNLLGSSGEHYATSDVRTFIVIDGLDHVVRANSGTPLLDELPAPRDLPPGVVIILGSQSLDMLRPAIAEHLQNTCVDGSPRAGDGDSRARVLDLASRRLSRGDIATIFEQLSIREPRLHFEDPQIDRAAELTRGHPLAVGLLCNAMVGLPADQPSTAVTGPDPQHAAEPAQADDTAPSNRPATVPEEAIDAVLDATVQYSGALAEDYASYLAQAGDDPAVLELLGDLGRMRGTLDMRWVQSWAPPMAFRSAVKIKHLFRRLAPDIWTFFHDSFRQFVLARTSVDDFGEPDPTADARRHEALADHCARAHGRPRIRGEELYHSARAGLTTRVLGLGTQDAFRDRFLTGTPAAVITEDIRLAMTMAAEADDAESLVALILAQTELSARMFNLKSVDLVGVYLDLHDPDGALSYAMTDRLLHVPIRHALSAASRLFDLGHPGGRLLFDAADPPDLLNVDNTADDDSVLELWAACAVRFRPLSVVATASQRIARRANALRVRNERRHVYQAVEADRASLLILFYAAQQLSSLARPDEAAQLTARFDDAREALRRRLASDASIENNAEYSNLLAQSDDWSELLEIEHSYWLAETGDTDKALDKIETLVPNRGTKDDAENEDNESSATGGSGEPTGFRLLEGSELALHIALTTAQQIAAAEAEQTAAGDTSAAGAEHDVVALTACRDRALRAASSCLDTIGVGRALSLDALLSLHLDDDGRMVGVFRRRRARVMLAALHAQAHGTSLSEDDLYAAVGSVAKPGPDRPAGASVDAEAALHHAARSIVFAADADRYTSILAVFSAAARTRALPAATLRQMLTRTIAALPAPTMERRHVFQLGPLRVRFLELLIDACGNHSEALARTVCDALAPVIAPPAPGRRRSHDWSERSERSFTVRDRQRLGLRLHRFGIDPVWLEPTIAELDAAIASTPEISERLERLVEQVGAHVVTGETECARELANRIRPEAFSVGARKDYQLGIWADWLLRAFDSDQSGLLKETTALAPILAAFTEATEHAAADASAALLKGVAKRAPHFAVRLMLWQLGNKAIAFESAHGALAEGLASALRASRTDNPQTTGMGTAPSILVAAVTALLIPISRGEPSHLIKELAALLDLLAPPEADAARAMLGRAVDTRLLPSARSLWRTGLNLPDSATGRADSQHDALQAVQDAAEIPPPRGAQYDEIIEEDIRGYRAEDGTRVASTEMAARAWTIPDALDVRAREASGSPFSWKPILTNLLTQADSTQLSTIADAFEGCHDGAAVLTTIARHALDLEAGEAGAIARRALARTEPIGWTWMYDSVRVDAWRQIIAAEGETARHEAILDLAATLNSADYWAGQLANDLHGILSVVAPDLSPRSVWTRIRNYIDAMIGGLGLPSPPSWTAPIDTRWWADLQHTTGSVPEDPPPTPTPMTVGESDTPDAVTTAVIDVAFAHLDYPAWLVREGATALVAWMLRPQGPCRAAADERATMVLAHRGDHPILIPGIPVGELQDRPEDPYCAIPPDTQPQPEAPADHTALIGVGGDAARENTARAVAAATTTMPSPDMLESLQAASQAVGWLPAACAHIAAPDTLPPSAPHALPIAYELSVPRRRTPHSGATLLDTTSTDLIDDVEPYASRAIALAASLGVQPERVLHRVARFAEAARSRLPSPEQVKAASSAADTRNPYLHPDLQSVRSAYARVLAEVAGTLDERHPLYPVVALDLVDIGLVRQPFDPAPAWVPVPPAREWPRATHWLDETTSQLSRYATKIAATGMLGDERDEQFITLTNDLLGGEALEFGPVAAILGAEHDLTLTSWEQHREHYLLASNFGPQSDGTGPATDRPSGPNPPPPPLIRVEDWLLADGSDASDTPAAQRDAMTLRRQPIILATTPWVLHSSAATWMCITPAIAARSGWRPHPRRALCWQTEAGALAAATLHWRRGPEHVSPPGNDTVGWGSAVLVTKVGMADLLVHGPIQRQHCLTRTFGPRQEPPDATQTRTVHGAIPEELTT